mgnify:CR=1 FL=1
MEDLKAKQWYVVHAYSGYENYVMREILQRTEHHQLGSKIGEVVVPSEEVVEMRAGQKRKSKRKFFPGYVLVNMVMDDETWHMIRAISNLTRLRISHCADHIGRNGADFRVRHQSAWA